MEGVLQENKVTANEIISSMIRSINEDSIDDFYKVAERYLNTLSKSGNSYLRLKGLINNKNRKLVQLKSLPDDVSKLLLNPVMITDDNVFLNESTKELFDELILEWGNANVFKQHNLEIRNKILFHGITGNGKTTIAKHIAKLINLPFVEVNTENVIISKMGNTGNNISKIFNEIKEPCVLFWDEIDSIGQKRGASSDNLSLENERIVNSVLVNIDKMSNKVVFIAATNRRDVLDTAFLRRFNMQHEFTPPSEIEKERFAKQIMEYYKLPESLMPTDISKYISYSDIKMMFMDVARKYVLNSLNK